MDDFIQWNGGTSPVSRDVLVTVQYTTGRLFQGKAGFVDWRSREQGNSLDGEVVRYKIS